MAGYKEGFLWKCAEAGVPKDIAAHMLKIAEGGDPALQQAQAIFKDWLTNRKYTVRRAETLSGIARRNNISLQELMEANNLTSSFVRPGQILKIPIQSMQKGKGSEKDVQKG